MDSHPLFLNDLANFLRTELNTALYPANEQGGVYKPSDRVIQRIGLALEPSSTTSDWVRDLQLDALWLHRPWQLNATTLPPDVGVLFHHLPFDECLTTGYNPRLANVLGMESLEELGYKQVADESGTLLPKRPIGMIGNVPERSFEEWVALIEREFGGYDRAVSGRERDYKRVAVVGAMNPSLVQEAHERGVGLYLTGEYRKGTQTSVDETGISVIAIGHRRTEEWGLRALAALLREEWSWLPVEVITAESS